MRKEQLLQARKVIRARHTIYQAEAHLDLSDIQNSNVQLALNILDKNLPKHLKKTTFNHYDLYKIKESQSEIGHRWIRLVGGSIQVITLDIMTKLIRDLIHRINQSEESSDRGTTTIQIPPENNMD